MEVKVSVIVPVYNVEKYLQECIDSLLAQTIGDIEFIFVNDASPDNSLAILLKNQKKNPNKIKVIDSKENLCQGGARNLGINIAQGEYIGFVDSDDLVSPSIYEKLYNKAKAIDADVIFMQFTNVEESFKFSHCNLTNYIPTIKWDKRMLEKENKELTDKDISDLIAYPVGVGVCSGLWRKELIITSNVRFPEKLRYEDNYWTSLIKCYIKKIGFLEEIGLFYRVNMSSTNHKRNAFYQYDRIIIEKLLLKEVKKRGFFEKYFSAWEYIYVFRYFINSVFIFLNKFDKPNYTVIKNIIIDLNKEFPGWYKNPYYKELTTIYYKTRNRFLSAFPFLFTKLYILLKKYRGKNEK